MNTTKMLQLSFIKVEASRHIEGHLENSQPKENSARQEDTEWIETLDNKSWRGVANKFHFRIVDVASSTALDILKKVGIVHVHR